MPICSYAQNFEDVLLWRALKDVEHGAYLDIGAQDPIFDSVSKGFYELGWRGVHVEPATQYAELLRKDRPDEIVIQVAVSGQPGMLTFYEIPDTGMSTGSNTIAMSAHDRGWTVVETRVAAVTLDQLLADFGDREIHWLKIDVEGFEAQALEGWRTSLVRPWIVVVEAIHPSTHAKTHREWEPLLLAKGYSFVHFDGLNRYYLSADHKELKAHFAYGPSLWDEIVLPEISRPARSLVQRRDEMLSEVRALAEVGAAAQNEAMAQVATLNQALERSRDQSNQTEDTLARARDDLERTRGDLLQAHSALAQTQGELQRARSDLIQTRASAGQTRGELGLTRADLDQAQCELDQVRAALDRSLDALDQTRGELNTTRDEREQVRSALDQTCSETQHLSEKWSRQRARLMTELGSVTGSRWWRMSVPFRRPSATLAILADEITSDSDLSLDGVCPAIARDLDELLSYEGEAFVRCAYATVLGREVDPEALRYCLGLLMLGSSRESVVRELATSEEGRRSNSELPGLDRVLRRRRPLLVGESPPPVVTHQPIIAPDDQAGVASRLATIKTQLEQLERLAQPSRAVARPASSAAGLQATSLPAVEAGAFNTIDAAATIIKTPDDVVWAPPMAWRFESPDVGSDDLSLTNTEMARALTELGHNARPVSPGVAVDVTALVAPPPLSIKPHEGAAILVGHDWDESGYPVDWIDGFNANLDGVACTSHHTAKILLDHGLTVPVAAVGLGIDHWERVGASAEYRAPGKAFRFLHVSTAGPDKGVDLLLESFGRLFASDDDVSLIIKSLGPVPAELVALLDELRSSNPYFPDVVLIGHDMADAELKALYAQCQVFVAPSRAEGFGLPIAQALLSGLPVVATARGGHLDYCNESNSWLVDYGFRRARTSNDLMVSVWFEPTANSLDDALLKALYASPAERFARAWSGRKRLLDHFTWKDAALRVSALVERSRADVPALKRKSRVGWVTTWNVKCGIFTHVEHLLELVPSEEFVIFGGRQEPRTRPDESNCLRSWTPGKDGNNLDEITRRIESWSVDALVIQFNYGFFNHFELNDFIEAVLSRGVVVIVDIHSTIDPYGSAPNWRLSDFSGALRKCHRVLAHGPADMDRLKALGLVDNVTLLPAGVLNRGGDPIAPPKPGRSPLIASFGFCFPNKGLRELIEAVHLLKHEGRPVRLLMLNAEHPDAETGSAAEVQRLRELIEKLGLQSDVELQTDFLDDDVCLAMLRKADLVVNPYQQTGESASGSARYGLAANRPVAVTPLPIFDDLGDAVFRMPGIAPHQIAQGIHDALGHLRERTETAVRVSGAARRWVEAHDFAQQGLRLMRTARALVRLEAPKFERRGGLAESCEVGSDEPRRVARGAFINTAKASCSIFESGRMVYNCINQSDDYTLDYYSLDMIDVPLFISEGIIRPQKVGDGPDRVSNYDFWVFNWHFITMAPHLDPESIRRLPGSKFTIVLELEPGDPLKMVPPNVFDGYIALDPSAIATDEIFPFPRPLEGDPRTPESAPRSVPVIGSFGFGTPGKGFEFLVEAVNREFDNAVVRVNIPRGTYTSSTDSIHGQDYANYISAVCKKIAKPGIEVRFTNDFMTPDELLSWCADNDLNCFMYTRRQTGLSATTDQAIMSGRPLLTSSNDTFRHIHQYIPPYPLIGMREAIETTVPAVLEMQRDWSRRAFGETFQRMLASCGVIAPSAADQSSTAAQEERRATIMVASPRTPDPDNVFWYATRAADGLSRSGQFEVIRAHCDDLSELEQLAAEIKPSAVIAVDFPNDREDVAVALKSVDGVKLLVSDDMRPPERGADGLQLLNRAPIIPYFTSASGLRSPWPSIWLIGFSARDSNLEQVVEKIWREIPDAELFMEVPDSERPEFAVRVSKLHKQLRRPKDAPLPIHGLPAGGEHLIANFAQYHLVVFYCDPTRARELESISSVAMTTERPVAFTRAAVFSDLQDDATYVEDFTIADIINLGVAAQIRLYRKFGEWQFYAKVHDLLTSTPPAIQANQVATPAPHVQLT